MRKNTALVIIDVQAGLFDPRWTVAGADVLLANLNTLITGARVTNTQVIFVQHSEDEGLVMGSPEWQLHAQMTPLANDLIIQKLQCDSFHETDLKAKLDALNVGRLVIAGLQTDHCINATTRRAHELGYDVTLVSDAHSTCDDGELTAKQIIADHNDSLGKIVKLEKTASVSFQ